MNGTAVPWGREIAVEQVGGVPYRMYEPRTRRLASLLEHADRWAGRAHVVQGDIRLDFADLVTAVRRKAAQLQQNGIGPGDRVALLGWNGPDWVVNVWAPLWLGAVPVLVNSWWSTREIEHAFALLHPRAVLADSRLASKLPAGTPVAPWPRAGETERPPAGARRRRRRERARPDPVHLGQHRVPQGGGALAPFDHLRPALAAGHHQAAPARPRGRPA